MINTSSPLWLIDTRTELNAWARNFLRGKPSHTEVVMHVYPDGGIKVVESRKVFGLHANRFGSGRVFERDPGEKGYNAPSEPLFKWIFPDGRMALEVGQVWRNRFPFDSIGVAFLSLVDETGKMFPESIWSEAEMCSVLKKSHIYSWLKGNK